MKRLEKLEATKEPTAPKGLGTLGQPAGWPQATEQPAEWVAGATERPEATKEPTAPKELGTLGQPAGWPQATGQPAGGVGATERLGGGCWCGWEGNDEPNADPPRTA